MINELSDIIKKTKLPKKLPKVIYVYAIQNDFLDIRLLQNIKQTYKNIEYWISDGSNNKEQSKKIKAFAKKYKINYYSLNYESKNKADNLNHFLKHANVKFDYLLISDIDTVIDKNFVYNAIKIFYSENNNNLGYISSLLIDHPGNNYFQNLLLFFNNKRQLLDSFKILLNNTSCNLYSACSLISSEMLDKINLFPNSYVENWTLEMEAYKNMYSGIILPTNVALKSFDANISTNVENIERSFSSKIKYIKGNIFKSFNTFYKKIFISSLRNLLVGFLMIAIFFIVSIFIWQILINWSANSYFAIILLIVLIVNTLIYNVGQFIIFRKLNYKNNNFFIMFALKCFFWITKVITIFKTWFKAIFLSKYFSYKRKRNKNNIQILWKWLLLFFSLAAICAVNLLFFYWYKLYWLNDGWKYFYVLLNISIFIFVYYSFSFIFLYMIGKKKAKTQYHNEEFIYCENRLINKLQENDLEVRKKCLNWKQ